jgi:ActR/RegA family two-component response regulator
LCDAIALKLASYPELQNGHASAIFVTPCRQSRGQTDAARLIRRSNPEHAVASFRPSILIVEDDYLVAGHLRDELEINRYTVVGVAGSYDDAVALAERFNPQIACVDIRIEGDRNGLELARALKDRGTRVVMMTGNPDMLTSDLAGAVVVKPFHADSLIVEVESAMRA